jgi:chromosome segregation ATPase
MRLEDLSDELETFTDRARGVLQWEIERAKKAVAALNTEKAATEKSLAELKGEHEEVQTQLKAALSNLDRGTTLAKVDHEIGEARKTLEKLKADTTKAETALEATEKQCKAAELQLMAANDGMKHIREERSAAVAELDRIRTLFKNVA